MSVSTHSGGRSSKLVSHGSDIASHRICIRFSRSPEPCKFQAVNKGNCYDRSRRETLPMAERKAIVIIEKERLSLHVRSRRDSDTESIIDALISSSVKSAQQGQGGKLKTTTS
eukprot:scaffold7549_cov110-Skeletonema_dohrnii-CCMP3373.AAC.2